EFRAKREFVDAARRLNNVDLLMDKRVTALSGDVSIESVDVVDAGGSKQTIPCDALLIRVGVVPNTDLFKGHLRLDEMGFITTDDEMRTSVAGVWAVGDVTGPIEMTIANAVAAGPRVAEKIVASLASGE
ncbi:MAG TPA: NAD(P)/FAD-dependent oxidoreductase, partial [Pyrinomonadaceae bacterium]|nr:NAD(P)/FAD-dependent oxidoreductase [Pyrinomonadaceae bacterium]